MIEANLARRRTTFPETASSRPTTGCGSSSLCRIAGLVLGLWVMTGCDQSKQEATSPPGEPAGSKAPTQQATTPPQPVVAPQPSKPSGPPLNTVESLVAPVALYPDPLLAELLVASTYPLEIVQAARWLDTKPDLATLKDKDWDPSVQRLTEVPSVVRMMNDHLEWTTALGNAFLENPDAVLGAVQTLRGKAVSSGFLNDTPEQKVNKKSVKVRVPAAAPEPAPAPAESTVQATPAVVRQEIVTIQPAKDDTLYVPQYNPEVAYSAPLAPPPGGTSAYPATTTAYPATPTQTYYPTYTPATTTTESSTTSPWLTFGAGALVGGLVTWGIMELADDDDWDDGYWGGYYGGPYRVVHHYGDSVCYRGDCWSGGDRGAGYRGDVNIDRGDINVNRELNISGNQISRDRTFKLNELRRTDRVWRHDPDHRRGQRYTAKAKERIGDLRQPDLAGQRLSGLQGVADGDRGIGGDRKPGGGLTRPSTLPAQRPLSADEIRGRLAEKKPERARPGPADDLKARRDQAGGKLAEARKEGAFAGASRPAGEVRREVERGKESRQIAKGGSQLQQKLAGKGPAPAAERFKERPTEARKPLAQGREGKARDLQLADSRPAPSRPDLQARAKSRDMGNRQQQLQQVRQRESAKPTAFGGMRDGSRARDFSQRGAASREGVRAQRAAHPDVGRARAGGGSGGFSRGGGGGGHPRGGGGGRRR